MEITKNAIVNRNSICFANLLIALCCIPVSASAQTVVTQSAFNQFMTTVTTGGSTTFASNGSILAAPSSNVLPTGNGWTSASNYGVSTGPNGAQLHGTGSVSLDNGKNIPVNVSAGLKSAGIAKAFMSMAKAAPLLGTGIAIYDALKDMGMTPIRLPDGTIHWGQELKDVIKYGRNYSDAFGSRTFRTAQEACDFNWGAGKSAPLFSGPDVVGASFMCKIHVFDPNYPTDRAGGNREPDSENPDKEMKDRDETDAERYIREKVGFAVTPFEAEAIKKAIAEKHKFDVEPAKVVTTGPATSIGTKTTTTGPDGKKVETQETTKIGYGSGGKISTAKDTAKVTTNPDGTTSTETETTELPPGEEGSTEKNTDLCKEHPDILACAKPDLDTPEAEIPKEAREVTYQEETWFGSGSCPANKTANMQLLGATVTVWDWEKTCEYALPLRALIISLASFAAFLIVMPGDNRT